MGREVKGRRRNGGTSIVGMNMVSFRPVGSSSFVALLSWEQNDMYNSLFNKCSNHFSQRFIKLAARPSLAIYLYISSQKITFIAAHFKKMFLSSLVRSFVFSM